MFRIEMRGVRKAFGATLALDGVGLAVERGVVHALIGENGAGKSTLMKVLSGALRPDAGRMLLDEQPYAPASPLQARRQGVVMVYQELALAPHLSVAENVVLGIEPARRGWIDRRRARQQAAEALAAVGHIEIDLAAPVAALSIAARQVVEIARALVLDARVLILDEPTSSLAADDVPRLFTVINRLRQRGVAVLYISHFLEEVSRIADRFTVLRDGRAVGEGSIEGATAGRIIEMMVGRQVTEMFPRLPHAIGEPVLELAGLGAPGVESASLELRRGEILGIAGLIGAGRTEMLRAVFGLAPVKRGAVRVAAVLGPASPAQRLAQGVGLLSEDRAAEGLASALSIADNLALSNLGRYVRRGWLDRAAQSRSAAEWMKTLGIRASGPADAVSSLSGGNQQKVALARLLHHDCGVLLLDEPTRGIDVATKAQIYTLIGQLAQAGKAVLLVSSYLPELLGICDTLAVMCRGRLGPKAPTSEWTEEAVLRAATGGTAA